MAKIYDNKIFRLILFVGLFACILMFLGIDTWFYRLLMLFLFMVDVYLLYYIYKNEFNGKQIRIVLLFLFAIVINPFFEIKFSVVDTSSSRIFRRPGYFEYKDDLSRQLIYIFNWMLLVILYLILEKDKAFINKVYRKMKDKCKNNKISKDKSDNKLPCIFNEWVCLHNKYDWTKLEQQQIDEFKECIRAGKKLDFWLDNERIRKELLLEDIHSTLEKLKDCKWKITIQHEKWIPTHMKIEFEEIEEWADREKYKDFVSDVWFVTYKKFWWGKTKVVWEKEFKYTIRNKNKEEIPTNDEWETTLR